MMAYRTGQRLRKFTVHFRNSFMESTKAKAIGFFKSGYWFCIGEKKAYFVVINGVFNVCSSDKIADNWFCFFDSKN